MGTEVRPQGRSGSSAPNSHPDSHPDSGLSPRPRHPQSFVWPGAGVLGSAVIPRILGLADFPLGTLVTLILLLEVRAKTLPTGTRAPGWRAEVGFQGSMAGKLSWSFAGGGDRSGRLGVSVLDTPAGALLDVRLPIF